MQPARAILLNTQYLRPWKGGTMYPKHFVKSAAWLDQSPQRAALTTSELGITIGSFTTPAISPKNSSQPR